MNPKQEIAELREELGRLRADVQDLSGNFYKNNFTSSQVFNKDVAFNGRMRVPVHSGAPSVGEVGDLIVVSGVLYVCTSTGPVTFTPVGTQS